MAENRHITEVASKTYAQLVTDLDAGQCGIASDTGQWCWKDSGSTFYAHNAGDFNSINIVTTKTLSIVDLSQNSIPFIVDANGLFSQDNTNFVWDNTDKKLTAKSVHTLSGGKLTTGANLGACGSNVTTVEHGHSLSHKSVLTLAAVSLGAVAGAAAEVIGAPLYTLPAGAIIVKAAYMSVALQATTQTADTPDVGLGTDNADGDAVATLDLADGGSGDAENILTGQTAADCNGTATVKTVANQILVIEAAGDHVIYLNVADTWTGADAAVTATGTVVIEWELMA